MSKQTTPIKKHNQKEWLQMFDRLATYKTTHSNCNVPKRYTQDASSVTGYIIKEQCTRWTSWQRSVSSCWKTLDSYGRSGRIVVQQERIVVGKIGMKVRSYDSLNSLFTYAWTCTDFSVRFLYLPLHRAQTVPESSWALYSTSQGQISSTRSLGEMATLEQNPPRSRRIFCIEQGEDQVVECTWL